MRTSQSDLEKIIAKRNERLQPKTTRRRARSSDLRGQLGTASPEAIAAVNRVLNTPSIAPRVSVVEQMRREKYAGIK